MWQPYETIKQHPQVEKTRQGVLQKNSPSILKLIRLFEVKIVLAPKIVKEL